jgi:hypothetical protein
MHLDEVGLYTVRNGKIVEESFCTNTNTEPVSFVGRLDISKSPTEATG